MTKEEAKKIIYEMFEFIENGEDTFKNKIYACHPGLYFFHRKEELHKLLNELMEKETYDIYDIFYIMSYLIKFLLSKYDSHTKLFFTKDKYLPIIVKVKNNKAYIIENSKEIQSLKGALIISINNIPIERILEEIETITSYGIKGYLEFNQEKCITSTNRLKSLPSINNTTNKFILKVLLNGKIQEIEFDIFNLPSLCTENLPENYSYEIIDDTLVVHYNSCTEEEKMRKLILKLEELTNKYNYKNFIIDLRENTGGDSSIFWPLKEFLKDKNVVVLVNEKVFSSGRMAFVDLKNIGAYSIGTDICTPLNCFGFNRTKRYQELTLGVHASTAYWYYDNDFKCEGFFKDRFTEYFKNKRELLEPKYLHPDEYVELTIEDIVNNNDVQLKRALSYLSELNLEKNDIQIKHK